VVVVDRILLSGPHVTVLEEEAVVRAIRSGWVAPLGPEVDAFEQEISQFVGAKYGVALSSGTASLHLALIAVGVRRGDSVITSSMTFVATANAISYIGAHPVFVDSLDDGTPDPDLIFEAICQEKGSGRTVSAVVAVDLYGRLADYSRIYPIVEGFGIPLVVDAAEAMGASRDGYVAGSVGECAILSFNGNKIITTSGGGMVLTDDLEKAQYIRYLATQAREPELHYEHRVVGYNYRMSNVCAALGRAQLVRLPDMIAMRRARRRQYHDFFSLIEGVSLVDGNSEVDNCWLNLIRIDFAVTGWKPSDLQKFLESCNIEARPLWKPMHLQPLYSGARFVGGHVAERLFETGLALPSGSAMSDSDMERVLDAISAFLESR
jgi:dTDP-4-amino-4,6-dideoxygalactose transaminase